MTMPGAQEDARTHRKRTVVNWGLALSTVIGALLVEAYALMQVMGTAGCGEHSCPHQGPGNSMFTLINYGAPAVAVVTIVVAFFTARRPRGWVAPVVAWALFILAFVILAVTFRN